MPHTENTKAFIEAANKSGNPMLKAYCGLVAVELVLKAEVGLCDHDVPSGLKRLNIKNPKPGGFNLSSLIAQLRNDIEKIQVTGKDGVRRTAPHGSYPYIRYTTFSCDGWTAPAASDSDLQALATTVSRVRNYLNKNYGYHL